MVLSLRELVLVFNEDGRYSKSITLKIVKRFPSGSPERRQAILQLDEEGRAAKASVYEELKKISLRLSMMSGDAVFVRRNIHAFFLICIQYWQIRISKTPIRQWVFSLRNVMTYTTSISVRVSTRVNDTTFVPEDSHLPMMEIKCGIVIPQDVWCGTSNIAQKREALLFSAMEELEEPDASVVLRGPSKERSAGLVSLFVAIWFTDITSVFTTIHQGAK